MPPDSPLRIIRLQQVGPSATREPKPEWLKVRAPGSPNYRRLKGLMRLPLAGKPGPRELSQFVIDFRHELARCSRAIRILGIGSHEAPAL